MQQASPDTRLQRSFCVFIDGTAAPDLPRAAGVYRFFGSGPTPLYIGKSIHIADRVRAHFQEARHCARHHRLMQSVERIDCSLTAGELGALLLENAEIKRAMPLFNRRQRRVKRPFTIQLHGDTDGYLQPRSTAADQAFAQANVARYGLFRSPVQLRERLLSLARQEGLCQRKLGLSPGHGPCFARQLRQCRGACVGEESPAAYNARLLAALGRMQIAAWPWPYALLIKEQDSDSKRLAWHLIDQWCHIGSFPSLRALPRSADRMTKNDTQFDLDSYHIVLRALRSSGYPIYAFHPHGKPRAQRLKTLNDLPDQHELTSSAGLV
jgi:excinuclease Cho